jgi:parallel beta-helix repeat protein
MNDSIIENIVANSNYRGIYLSGKNSNNDFQIQYR